MVVSDIVLTSFWANVSEDRMWRLMDELLRTMKQMCHILSCRDSSCGIQLCMEDGQQFIVGGDRLGLQREKKIFIKLRMTSSASDGAIVPPRDGMSVENLDCDRGCYASLVMATSITSCEKYLGFFLYGASPFTDSAFQEFLREDRRFWLSHRLRAVVE